ncbi:sulfatase [Halococcus thailandensis]|uniref:Sulfatase n=1 Tax=Halococcus thailandensis JCM 13552 TaxID=1227457 RepID=M0MVA5_9EURY|nr:sulfatase [Halococcus thailandensis]EMA49506.1 sulfatase [Halococcus thailandensis JCM 13552]
MRQPNVVWITLESTRADHTTMGGYTRDTTPNLDRIAGATRGRSFDNCHTHGIWTLASSASILTGTTPTHHGAGMQNDAIPAELDTVPERLQRAGYRTTCLSPNSHLSGGTDLDRGFDEFTWLSADTLVQEAGPRILLKYLHNCRRHGPGLTTDTRKHGTGFVMNEIAKRRIGSYAGSDEPFFLYAHYGDPHHPYHPPRRFLEPYADDFEMTVDEALAFGQYHHDNFHQLIADGCELSDDEWNVLHALYDAEIAHTDELVGDLFAHIRGLDLDNTVFVVTADHGELFGEQGMLAHLVVADDAVTHVPCIVHGADALVDHDGETVQHADLMTTLLESADADTTGMQGVDLREETREHTLTQRGAKRTLKNLDRFEELNAEFDRERYHEATLHALRTDEFKYLKSDERAELFALPDETSDVSDDESAVVENLDDELETILETDGQPVSTEDRDGEFTDAMKQQLSDLGYLVD